MTSKSIEFGYLTCLKSFDNVPLFSRMIPGSKNLPLQIIDTLNSIFVYGNKHAVKIHSIDSKKFKIIWKMYHSNITLILVEQLAPIDEQVYFNKLDLIFDALVLIYGLDDLINITNIEKFRLEIKLAFKLLDIILDNHGKFGLFGGYLTDCVDMILSDDIPSFQNQLDNSCVAVNSSYACLIVNGRIITASTAWWELKTSESHLISLLCLTLSQATSRDIPIYLPHKNPHQPFRLLTYNLSSNNVVLCFICSEKPTVDSVEPIIKKLWHPIYKSLINLNQLMPRNLTNRIVLDQNMIGFLLINKKNKCCTSSLCINEKANSNISIDGKSSYELLKYSYLNISSTFFNKFRKAKSDHSHENDYNEEQTKCQEAYILTSDVKCFAINDQHYEFYALYNKAIPVYAIRGITFSCLNVLTN